MHPFPAEHDQQQAHALDILKESKAFVLVHFPEREGRCSNPLCEMLHHHRTARVIASCSHRDLHYAMDALGEEVMLTTSIDMLMSLSPSQREQIAAMLLDQEGAFYRAHDDEA